MSSPPNSCPVPGLPIQVGARARSRLSPLLAKGGAMTGVVLPSGVDGEEYSFTGAGVDLVVGVGGALER